MRSSRGPVITRRWSARGPGPPGGASPPPRPRWAPPCGSRKKVTPPSDDAMNRPSRLCMTRSGRSPSRSRDTTSCRPSYATRAAGPSHAPSGSVARRISESTRSPARQIAHRVISIRTPVNRSSRGGDRTSQMLRRMGDPTAGACARAPNMHVCRQTEESDSCVSTIGIGNSFVFALP